MIFRALIAVTFTFSAHAADSGMPKAKFLDGMKGGIPPIFCEESTYFRKCFPVTEEACKKSSATASADCAAKLEKEVPAFIPTDGEGRKMGEKFGACVGEKLELEWAKTKVASADCKDALKWK